MPAGTSDRPKHNLACMPCRKLKIRCTRSEDQSEAACQRCIRLKLSCEYHKRRPRQSVRRSGDAPDPLVVQSPSIASDDQNPLNAGDEPAASLDVPSHARSDIVNLLHVASRSDHTTTPVSAVDTALTSQAASSSGIPMFAMRPSNFDFNTGLPPPPPILPTIHEYPDSANRLTSPHSSNSTFNTVDRYETSFAGDQLKHRSHVDVSERLDPVIPDDTSSFRTFQAVPDTIASLPEPSLNENDLALAGDPVSSHFVSLIEATVLLQSFHSSLNPLLALLDPVLHTINQVRRSPVLFTAILAAASKYFKPNLYEGLCRHAQMLLDRSIAKGEAELDIIQALLILVFCKSPTDRSAWIKLGIGIRLGYQLGLHVIRTDPLPLDEHQIRVIRDRERTWYCLSLFDLTYCEIFELPVTIRTEEIAQPDIWVNETRSLAITADRHLASSVATRGSHTLWLEYKQKSSTTSDSWRRSVLRDLYGQYWRHLRHWYPDEKGDKWCSDAEYRLLQWYDQCNLFKIKQELVAVALQAEKSSFIHDCLDLAEQFTDKTEMIARDGNLSFLQDTLASRLTLFGGILYKMFRDPDVKTKRPILNMVKRIHTCCVNVSDAKGHSATSFVARYYRRLLQQITIEPIPPTSYPSPVAHASDLADPFAGYDFGPDLVTDINEFLQSSASKQPDLSVPDDTFWSSLFAETFPELDQTGK